MAFVNFSNLKWRVVYFILAVISQAWCINGSPTVNNDFGNGPIKNEALRRSVRSPQLFGKNVLTDIRQQLKPPSLNDFNEFRQKMANLANLTALLEQAIAAEKAARTSLQSFVASIKDQITGIKTAVNPDPEDYWLESTECGGVLVSQTGRISYKLNVNYADNERCTWTVRANFRSKIRITFSNGNLEDNHDYLSVTELREKKGVDGAEWTTKRLQPRQPNIFEGPLIFITFVSDGSIRKTGFQLDFEGMGSNINTRTLYQHFHFTDWVGQFDSFNLSEKLEKNGKSLDGYESLKTSIVVNPSYWNASKLSAAIPEGLVSLRPDECDKTNLAILKDFPIKSQGTSDMCCAESCESYNYETSNRILLALFSSSDLSERSQFQINWATNTNVRSALIENSCGGLLRGDSGKISYKTDIPYENNERCGWVIYPEQMENAEIKLQLLKDGFEYKYDYVTVTYLKHEDERNLQTDFLYKAGEPMNVPASFAFIQFYSDGATFGSATGFELIWEFKETDGQHPAFQFYYTTDQTGSLVFPCALETTEEARSTLFAFINPQSKNAVSTVLLRDSATQNQNIEVFTGSKGNFTRSSDTGKYFSEDGTLILMHQCQSGESEESITWEKEEISSRSNADDQTYFKSEDTCGEVLFGDSGSISYKLGKGYSVNERCTWVIRAKSLSTITVQLKADGFESCCDKVEIHRLNTEDGSLDLNGVTINRENRFQTLEGPLLLVTFFSDHSVVGTGFELEFQTKGEPINDSAANQKYFHSYHVIPPQPATNSDGPVVIETNEQSVFMNTFYFNETVLNATVSLQMENLQIDECNKDSVLIYKMPEHPEYQLLKRYPSEDVCAAGLSQTETALAETKPATSSEFKLSGPAALIIIGKFEEANPAKHISILLS